MTFPSNIFPFGIVSMFLCQSALVFTGSLVGIPVVRMTSTIIRHLIEQTRHTQRPNRVGRCTYNLY